MSAHEIYAEYAHLIRPIAARLARQLPGHSLQDMEQTGSVGLLQAVSKFQERRAATFALLAKQRIRGAMLDSLAAHRRLGSDDGPEASEPETASRSTELAEVREAVADLPRLQREIIDLHYGREMSLRAAGRAAGISCSAAARRERRAIAALRKALGVAA